MPYYPHYAALNKAQTCDLLAVIRDTRMSLSIHVLLGRMFSHSRLPFLSIAKWLKAKVIRPGQSCFSTDNREGEVIDS